MLNKANILDTPRSRYCSSMNKLWRRAGTPTDFWWSTFRFLIFFSPQHLFTISHYTILIYLNTHTHTCINQFSPSNPRAMCSKWRHNIFSTARTYTRTYCSTCGFRPEYIAFTAVFYPFRRERDVINYNNGLLQEISHC